MVCKNCGFTSSDEEKYCPVCGRPITTTQVTNMQQSTNHNPTSTPVHNTEIPTSNTAYQSAINQQGAQAQYNSSNINQNNTYIPQNPDNNIGQSFYTQKQINELAKPKVSKKKKVILFVALGISLLILSFSVSNIIADKISAQKYADKQVEMAEKLASAMSKNQSQQNSYSKK